VLRWRTDTSSWFAQDVTDFRTQRLILHAVDVAEAERIVARTPGPDDVWAEDYPFDGDIVALTMFLRATAADGDQRPFGYYRISRASDGQAIGGAGFKGRPVDSSAEIGYGLAPSGRGQGYAAEAVEALATIAACHGVTTVRADTTLDNIASQRTLTRAGFTLVRFDDQLQYYELSIPPR
jgi:RimJ/RimL family protein N-acetyltransferase